MVAGSIDPRFASRGEGGGVRTKLSNGSLAAPKICRWPWRVLRALQGAVESSLMTCHSGSNSSSV
jgi:hypothetical protein